MDLEILVSTMNKTSLSFLDRMFPGGKKKDLLVLIINQTSRGNELVSDYDDIRVINSYEKGLSKSRNLAIKNAKGDICLIADDDIKYKQGFWNIVLEAFSKHSKASVIRFKIGTFEGVDYKKYPAFSKRLNNLRDISGASSIEIGFRRIDIIENSIFFNELFGLGANFKSGEEFLFLRDVIKKSLSVYFENVEIVKHSKKRNTVVGSDDYIRACAALYHIAYKRSCYFILIKLIFSLYRNGIISFNQLYKKYDIGVLTINGLKSPNKN